MRVLRLSAGAQVVVLDGAGHEHVCVVEALTRHSVELAVVHRNDCPRPPYRLILIQAVTKGRSMDLIIQKATELGAYRLIPILAERSVPQLEGERVSARVERWVSVAVEAIKQCGSPWLPMVDPPRTLQAWLDRGERFDLALLASLQPDGVHPRDRLEALWRNRGPEVLEVAVWIGPEGDFTVSETGLIVAAGAFPVTLGPQVLRSETAALYALSCFAYEMQYQASMRKAR